LITVVIPAYNEERHLRDAVLSTLAAAASASIEVIIIDDGSRDGTGAVIRSLEREHANVRSVTHPVNRGFGASFKSGLAAAKGDRLCLFPGDNATSVYSMKNVLARAGEADVVIGYFMDTERRSRLRNAISTLFNQVYSLTFGVHVKYLQGTPCYATALLRGVPIRTDGLGVLAEVNVKLLLGGASFLEVDGFYNATVSKSAIVGPLAVLRNAARALRDYVLLIWEVKIRDRAKYRFRPRRVRPADAGELPS
jgi:glycosyltransferase involved in cell wall biosynthesis